jgi:hypothetical protein
MEVELVTKADLQAFRIQLLNDIKVMLANQAAGQSSGRQLVEGYQTKDVRRILGCSVNKLVSLRISRKIRWKKVGGTIYYNREDVRRLMEEGY